METNPPPVAPGPADAVARLAAEHLRSQLPALTATATPEQLAQAAAAGVQSARGHGFNRRPQVYFMVQLSSALGSHFDTDPQYEWLRPLLDNEAGLPATHRSRVMGWHLDAFRARAYGSHPAMVRMALARLVALDQQALARVGESLDSEGLCLLSALFPRRLDYMDRDATYHLLNAARRGAAMHGGGHTAAGLLLLLMFLFGHQVLHDPLRLWLKPQIAPLLQGMPMSTEALMRRVADHAAASLDALWTIKP